MSDCLGRMVVSSRDPWEVEPEGVVNGITRREVIQPYESLGTESLVI